MGEETAYGEQGDLEELTQVEALRRRRTLGEDFAKGAERPILEPEGREGAELTFEILERLNRSRG
jgi:hypothetical protein